MVLCKKGRESRSVENDLIGYHESGLAVCGGQASTRTSR